MRWKRKRDATMKWEITMYRKQRCWWKKEMKWNAEIDARWSERWNEAEGGLRKERSKEMEKRTNTESGSLSGWFVGEKREIYLYFNINDNFNSSSCKLFKTLSLFFCRDFII